MDNQYIPHHPLSGRSFNIPSRPLPDIRWISGGPCGGKSSVSRKIAADSDLEIYDCDLNRQRHFEEADPVLHPALSRKIEWAEFFSSPDEDVYLFWESLCFERTEMILDDLSRYDSGRTLIVEGVYPLPEIITAVTPEAGAVFLFAEEDFLRSCYYGRESTLWMEEVFLSCGDPVQSKNSWIDKCLYIDRNHEKRAVSAGYPVLKAGFSTDWKSYRRNISAVLGL